VLDATTQQVRSTAYRVQLQPGLDLTWDLGGRVIVRFTNAGGVNTVLSGIFLN
jgi:hypothetical protein